MARRLFAADMRQLKGNHILGMKHVNASAYRY